MREQAPLPYLCISPACGPDCCGCNCAISDANMRQYAVRYAFLRERLLAADFDWNESGECALVFKWPRNVPVGGNCDNNIDAAIAQAAGSAE